MYNRVDARVIAELERIVGAENVLAGPQQEEKLERYTHDEVVGLAAAPEVVVLATSAQQVSEVMRLAQATRIPVTPRGAGSGLSGGAVPVCGGIVLSLERMNRILEIDHGNLMVTVEPGVITGNLHRAVEAEGLFYPPDPASLESCSIGGNIAEGAGGPRAVKYGVTKDYVCGLEAVLPSGEIINLGGKLVKDVTGYDLTQLLVGSEGTLASIAEIILRLIPLPQDSATCSCRSMTFRQPSARSRPSSRPASCTTDRVHGAEGQRPRGKLLRTRRQFAKPPVHLLIQLGSRRLGCRWTLTSRSWVTSAWNTRPVCWSPRVPRPAVGERLDVSPQFASRSAI